MASLDDYAFSLENETPLPKNKKNLFKSKTLPIQLLSLQGLVPPRLVSPQDSSKINHPFFLFQKRIDAFSQLMNFNYDQNSHILYGNACIGKSIFFAYFYLTLLLQREKFTTIYLQNFQTKNWENHRAEIFWWFFGEIQDSLPLKIMMHIAFSVKDQPPIAFFSKIVKYLIEVSHSKNKKIIFIQDQIDSNSDLFFNYYEFETFIGQNKKKKKF